MEGSVITTTIAAVEGRETYQGTPATATRRCAWSKDGVRCPAPAELRRGARGPLPRWCETHRLEHKHEQDNGASKPRTPYKACCAQWQASGHRGLCPQHRQCREAGRPTAPAERPGVHRHDEAAFLAEVFAFASGFHIERRLDVSDRGPWEGRTVAPNGDLALQVFNDDPFRDAEAAEWYGANPGWRSPE
jgi:hypothetical protein